MGVWGGKRGGEAGGEGRGRVGGDGIALDKGSEKTQRHSATF